MAKMECLVSTSAGSATAISCLVDHHMVGETAPNPQSAIDKRTGHKTPPSQARGASPAAHAERQALGATAKETTATPSSLKISISSNSSRKCGDLCVSIGPTHDTTLRPKHQKILHISSARRQPPTASHGPVAGLATPPSRGMMRGRCLPLKPCRTTPSAPLLRLQRRQRP